MQDLGIKVRMGDISTYEEMSDNVLADRKAELRSRMRHPFLTTAEFIQNVVSQTTFAALAVGWGAWNGIERIISTTPSVSKNLFLRSANGTKHRYVADVNVYNSNILVVAEHWAEYHFHQPNDVVPPPSAVTIADQIIKNTKDNGWGYTI